MLPLHLRSNTDGYSLKIVFISQINIFVNINTILEPLHEIEVLGAVGNNLPDFCPDIHPQTEADVKTAVNMDIVISFCTLSCVYLPTVELSPSDMLQTQ